MLAMVVEHCFSCEAKGRGVIDLAMQVRKVGFKEAVALLEGITPVAEQTPA
jgi:DNA primase